MGSISISSCWIKGAGSAGASNLALIINGLYGNRAASDFGQGILGCIGDANKALHIMCHQIAQLQIIFSRIVNANIAHTVQANNFTIAGAGNAARQIDFTAASVHILHQNFLG